MVTCLEPEPEADSALTQPSHLLPIESLWDETLKPTAHDGKCLGLCVLWGKRAWVSLDTRMHFKLLCFWSSLNLKEKNPVNHVTTSDLLKSKKAEEMVALGSTKTPSPVFQGTQSSWVRGMVTAGPGVSIALYRQTWVQIPPLLHLYSVTFGFGGT